MERRFEEKERDWLERVTALEAELNGLRAQAVETRGRLRRAEASSPSAEVFERSACTSGYVKIKLFSRRVGSVSQKK